MRYLPLFAAATICYMLYAMLCSENDECSHEPRDGRQQFTAEMESEKIKMRILPLRIVMILYDVG